MKIIKRSYSPELYGEFSELIVATGNIFRDAIIGINGNGNLVYDFYLMHDLLEENLTTTYGKYYQNDFLDKDHFTEHIHERVCKNINRLERELGISAPIFCTDKHFLNQILPNLEENQAANFNEEN